MAWSSLIRRGAQSAAPVLAIAIAIAPTVHAAPNGVPQRLKPHRAAHVAPKSLLAPVAVAPNAAQALAKVYGGSPINVTTYHYDNTRTGWNASETDLTPATVSGGHFGLLATLSVDDNVFAQPLMVSNFVIGKTKHNVLIIATGANTVYAFDAQTYATLWQVNLGAQQSSNDVGCGDVQPGYGISSTPVIVKTGAKATIYLVAATEPNPYEFHTKLHALDLATGKDLVAPVEISPSATLSNKAVINFDPQNQWSRASLAYNAGSIFISIGSHCDNNAGGTTGWLLRYNAALNLQRTFHTIDAPNSYELASIWMSGFAPAIDPNGNVFAVTGNGDYNSASQNWGESVIKLNSNLSGVSTSFTPYDYSVLNADDTDFGSGGVMLLPSIQGQTAPPMAVAIGKDAVLYLLNRNSLGGLAANDAGALQALRLGGQGSGVWGGPAFFNGPSGPTILTQINGDVLRSFTVNVKGAPKFTALATGSSYGGYGGSIPIVSSNGVAAHTAVAWLVRRSAPIELEAYDATALGAPIYSANIGGWSNPGEGNPFLTAMEANGRVYVASYLTVQVFGLTQ
jgi:hypothetical protein